MFEDMLVNPLLVEVVLEHITEDNCFRSRRYAEAGMDMLRIGDNVGMEDRMTMHPEMWRRHLKPRLAKEISVVPDVQPDMPVWYHSDGTLIIDDLIEVRVTVLTRWCGQSAWIYTS